MFRLPFGPETTLITVKAMHGVGFRRCLHRNVY